MPRFAVLVSALGLLGLSLAPAEAHKLKVFATAVGNEVSGYAYFAPGGRAQEADVTVTLPDGAAVAHLKTDDHGEFTFTAKTHADHRILVDAGDGHEATYRIPVDQLGPTSAVAPTSSSAAAATPSGGSAPGAAAGRSDAQISALVDQAVARQLRPLREDINGWQEKIWLHDVLGGLGYIIGLGGLVYGLTGTRRSREREDGRSGLREARR